MKIIAFLAAILLAGSASAQQVNIPLSQLPYRGAVQPLDLVGVQPQGYIGLKSSYAKDFPNMPRATNNAGLTALATTFYPSIVRLGYAAAGDAPALVYTPGGSACSLNAGAGDGGSQVPSSDGKCWLANFPSTVDVREFGAAPGAQADTALNNAIAYACTSHLPLTLPYPGDNPYLVNSSIHIGNGNASTLSTCNGVSLSVTQQYNSSTSGTTPQGLPAFKYNGASTSTIPFVAQGPAAHIEFRGINVNCNSTCKTGIEINNIIDGEFKDLGVEGNTGPGFILISTLNNTWQGSLEGTHFSNFQAQAPGTGGSGMQVGLDDCLTFCATGPPVIADQFDNITLNYDGNTANTYGIRFGFVSQITMTNLRIAPVAGSSGNPIVVRAPDNTGGSGGGALPTDITLIHPLIDTAVTAVSVDTTHNAWVPGHGGLNITDWSTVWQGFPTYGTNPKAISGNDTAGRNWPGAVTWAPTDVSGGLLTLTVHDATWSLNGNTCTVVLTVTYPTNSDGNAAEISGPPAPCSPITGSGTSRATGPVYTTYATPITALMSNAGVVAFYTFGGSAVPNSGFTGKDVRMTFTFPVN